MSRESILAGRRLCLASADEVEAAWSAFNWADEDHFDKANDNLTRVLASCNTAFVNEKFAENIPINGTTNNKGWNTVSRKRGDPVQIAYKFADKFLEIF